MIRVDTVLFVCLAGLANAQDPRLVADVHASGSAAPFSILGRGPRPGELLVALDDGVRGTELWRTDGTAAGTVLVRELVPGPLGASFTTGSGGSAGCMFVADRGFGQEMWASDGTAAGTRQLFSAAGIRAVALRAPEPGARIGDHFLFDDGWGMAFLSDGTASGTRPLLSGSPLGTFAFGGAFYTHDTLHSAAWVVVPSSPPSVTVFAAAYVTNVNGEPIISQYTLSTNTTTLIAIARPGQPSIAGLNGWVPPFAIGGQLAYIDEQTGLWTWNPGSPPLLLATSAAGLGTPPLPLLVQAFGTRLLFRGRDAATGFEPWVTDGTVAGTQVLDLTPGPFGSVFQFAGAAPDGQRALLWTRTAATGSEPWSTDGTIAGTVQLADLEPGPGDSALDARAAFAFASAPGQRRLLLPVSTSARGRELWITDGTAAGSSFLTEIAPGPADGVEASTWGYLAGHRVLLCADDGTHGLELWAVDLEGSTTRIERQGTRSFEVHGDAVIGASVTFESSGLAPQDIGAVAIGWPATAAPVGPGGTFLHVDPALTLPWLPITPNAAGAWSLAVTVPNLPGLVGLDLVAQAGFLGPTTGTAIELGSAYWLGIGR